MRDRSDEKERLMEEVLGRKRSYESDETTEVELTLESTKENSKQSSSILKSANDALSELNRILQKQKTELEQMSNEIRSNKSDIREETLVDIDTLQKELEDDYGSYEPQAEVVKDFNSAEVFSEIQAQLDNEILGQKDAIKQLTIAFRRPFVMGTDGTKAKNVILVSGPHGSGKHESISLLTKHLKERKVLASDDVYTIDMSRYTSSSQEQIFLQDLYEAISGNGSVICFENFETSFPSFVRMVDSLVVDGKVVLNKRYVLNNGMLVENQTGLVTDSVDSIDVAGKYLVFITSGKVSKVQDVFGANFIYHVLDQVAFQNLDDESISKIITSQTEDFINKSNTNLHVQCKVREDVRSWVHTHFDKTRGADSITTIFYDFYVSLSQMVLHEGLGSDEEILIQVQDDVPMAIYKDIQVALSRQKNSSEEIDEINKELDQIVGLVEVKDYIQSLQSHIAMQQKRKEQGMKTASVSKHMIFTGNPGTGKTTIARLLSRYMKAIGALSQGQLVEVTRADLVAQYVGQTAPLTMSVIKSALGGVLFIDEAYSLYRGKDDSFGLEAIDTLVKAMEDNREDLIVVLAGYEKEMSTFLESNSGLKSRFPNFIHFPDYTGEQLVKIAQIQATNKGYEIEESAVEKLRAYFDEVQSINAMEAGNGRLARNMIEDAILQQSKRLVSEENGEMSLLKEVDFDFTIKVQKKQDAPSLSLEDLMKQMNNNS